LIRRTLVRAKRLMDAPVAASGTDDAGVPLAH
jgi:hypothetical protein